MQRVNHRDDHHSGKKQVAETDENGSHQSSEQQQVAMQHSAENHGSHMHVQIVECSAWCEGEEKGVGFRASKEGLNFELVLCELDLV